MGAETIHACLGDQVIDYLNWAETYIDQLDPLTSRTRSAEFTSGTGYRVNDLDATYGRLTGSEWKHGKSARTTLPIRIEAAITAQNLYLRSMKQMKKRKAKPTRPVKTRKARGSVEIRWCRESEQQLRERIASPEGQRLLDELARIFAEEAVDRMLRDSRAAGN